MVLELGGGDVDEHTVSPGDAEGAAWWPRGRSGPSGCRRAMATHWDSDSHRNLENSTFSSDDLKPSKELGFLLRTFAGLNRGMTWSFVFRQDAMAMTQGADAAVRRRRVAAEAAVSPRVRDVL